MAGAIACGALPAMALGRIVPIYGIEKLVTVKWWPGSGIMEPVVGVALVPEGIQILDPPVHKDRLFVGFDSGNVGPRRLDLKQHMLMEIATRRDRITWSGQWGRDKVALILKAAKRHIGPVRDVESGSLSAVFDPKGSHYLSFVRAFVDDDESHTIGEEIGAQFGARSPASLPKGPNQQERGDGGKEDRDKTKPQVDSSQSVAFVDRLNSAPLSAKIAIFTFYRSIAAGIVVLGLWLTGKPVRRGAFVAGWLIMIAGALMLYLPIELLCAP